MPTIQLTINIRNTLVLSNPTFLSFLNSFLNSEVIDICVVVDGVVTPPNRRRSPK